MQVVTIDEILSEDFTIPDYNEDLAQLITESKILWEDMLPTGRLKKMYRVKINELIQEYNDRVQMDIFSEI